MRAVLRRSWPIGVPVLALGVLAATWTVHELPGWAAAIVGIAIAGAVLVAVHHAEAIAHRIGEPYGSLVLAVAVTVIEVGLILMLMLSSSGEYRSYARDTVFAAVMITTNGVVGLSLLIGSLKHGIVRFNREGAGALLAAVITLAALSFVLPLVTTGGELEFTQPQLLFVAIASAVVYVLVVTTQTVRHREFFLPIVDENQDGEPDHDEPPTMRATWLSVGMLFVALIAVVGLAKVLSPTIEYGVAALGLPVSFVGVVIALLVLLPESISAVRAASRNHLQISLNLAYGSALASIGLTIPTIAIVSLLFTGPVHLGLGGVQLVLLILTAVVSTITIGTGRSTRLQGGVHLVIFATFLFLSIFP